jgi:ABC-type transporter Mla subunit MlaD
MMRATSAALLALLISCIGMVLWLGHAAHQVLMHLDGAVTRAQAIETKANATLVNLDKGTAVWAASAKDQAGAIQDLATDAHGTLSEADDALGSIRPVSRSLISEVGALKETTAQATRAASALADTAETANRTIQSAQPLLEASTRAVEHFDSLVNSPDLSQALSHVDGMTASGDAILGDARKVADHETANWLKPVKWYMQPIKKSSDLLDIAAAISRHTP